MLKDKATFAFFLRQIPAQRIGPPEDVAPAVAYLTLLEASCAPARPAIGCGDLLR